MQLPWERWESKQQICKTRKFSLKKKFGTLSRRFPLIESRGQTVLLALSTNTHGWWSRLTLWFACSNWASATAEHLWGWTGALITLIRSSRMRWRLETIVQSAWYIASWNFSPNWWLTVRGRVGDVSTNQFVFVEGDACATVSCWSGRWRGKSISVNTEVCFSSGSQCPGVSYLKCFGEWVPIWSASANGLWSSVPNVDRVAFVYIKHQSDSEWRARKKNSAYPWA
jgi:hypothetical protein